MRHSYTTAYLSLGSNLGNREKHLNNAVEKIEQACGTIFARSSLYETKPWGFESEYLFLNIAVGLKTVLSPVELFEKSKQIERTMGRNPSPSEKYSDRVIDIDILFYGNEILASPVLEIPHPRLHLRAFVLDPLNEIAPNLMHPTLKKTVEEIRKKLHEK